MQVTPNSAAPHVTGAIRQAAQTTGASFDYLLATAQIESNLNPGAQASTSSAQGLYQFIDQTWLGTMKRSGASFGLGRYANAIVQGADGRLDVPDPAMRDTIMKLRTNPAVSAMMAGAYASDNAAQLTDGLGRAPSEGELYIAHFLGSDGATKLIGAALSAPTARAADVFPQAAAANRSIFYDKAGRARGVLDVYRVLTGRYEVARAGTMAAIAGVPPVAPGKTALPPVAAAALRGSLPPETQVPRPPMPMPVPVQPRAVAAAVIPDTAGLTSAYADARTDRPRADSRPLFQSMFTTPPARQGVSPIVSSVWMPAKAGADNAVQTLDLFTDIKPGARKPGGKV